MTQGVNTTLLRPPPSITAYICSLIICIHQRPMHACITTFPFTCIKYTKYIYIYIYIYIHIVYTVYTHTYTKTYIGHFEKLKELPNKYTIHKNYMYILSPVLLSKTI